MKVRFKITDEQIAQIGKYQKSVEKATVKALQKIGEDIKVKAWSNFTNRTGQKPIYDFEECIIENTLINGK